MFLTLVLAGLSTAGAVGTWELTDYSATSVGGVFATSADVCYAAFNENVVGPGLAKTVDTGSSWENSYGGFLNTDTARDTEGNQVIASIGAIFYTKNDGPITKLDTRDITFAQNVKTFGKTSFGVIGTHFPNGVTSDVINGVALSTDGATTWNYYDAGLPDVYTPRYAAFPSDSTWYVTHGSWGSTPNVRTPESINATSWQLNSKVVYDKMHGVQYKKSLDESIFFGAVSKTTDGGKTFKKVYDANGRFYMNDIDCVTDDICMVVSEGGDNAYALRTEDGGQTWDTVLSVSSPTGPSLAAVKMLSTTEVWVSGGTFEKGVVGWFYHTVDGGKSWELHTLDKAYSLDLTFADGFGYSPAMSEFGSSIAVYKP